MTKLLNLEKAFTGILVPFYGAHALIHMYQVPEPLYKNHYNKLFKNYGLNDDHALMFGTFELLSVFGVSLISSGISRFGAISCLGIAGFSFASHLIYNNNWEASIHFVALFLSARLTHIKFIRKLDKLTPSPDNMVKKYRHLKLKKY